jgi:hypothetical protein
MSVSYFTASSQPSFTAYPVTVGPIEWMTPFAGKTDKIMFRQTFQQDIDSWSPAALDAAHATATTYLLVREDDFSSIGGGQHKWNRYFACTPPQRIEYSSYAAQFPGIYSTRDPLATGTQAKITYDYFLVGTVPSLAQESRLVITGIYDQPLLAGSGYLNNGGGTLDPTSPSAVSYMAFVTADSVTASSFSITAEQQTLARWEGNFYERKTVNVKAK